MDCPSTQTVKSPCEWKFLGCVSCIVQPTMRSILGVYDNCPPLAIDTCGKLPAMLALFAVLGPVRPRTIKPFLSSFLC